MNASEHGVRRIAISCFRSHSRRGRGFRRRFPLLVPRKTRSNRRREGKRKRCVRARVLIRATTGKEGKRGYRWSRITCQNTDNSTVWSRTSADILSHGWPSVRTDDQIQEHGQRDSCHSPAAYAPANASAAHLLPNRKNDKLVDLLARFLSGITLDRGNQTSSPVED